MYHVGGNTYEVVKDHRNGWNYEVFRERYSEVLERYDYIVGDWGYNQLRLKGFFKEPNKGPKDASVSLVPDYLNEYCNFGCAYFIIEKLSSRRNQPEREESAAGEQDILRTSETDKGKDPDHKGDYKSDYKPRQHYTRTRDNDRNRGQDKGEQRAKEPDRGRDSERHRGQDGRAKGSEQPRGRDQQRHQTGHKEEHKGKPHAPDRTRGGNPPARNKGGDQRPRDKDAKQDREREKSEPTA